MSGGTGYIKAYRSLQDHELRANDPACRAWAWLDFIMLAAWEPHFVKVKGESILVDRGDVVASVRFLMKRWRWGAGKTHRFLMRLEADQMVFKKRHGSGNGSPGIYTVVKYDLFQSIDQPAGTVNGTLAERLRNETKKGKKKHTLAHEVSEASPPLKADVDFDRFWSVYPRKVGRLDALKAWKALHPRPDLETVLDALTRQQTSQEWTREGGRFIPYPAGWLRKGRWLDEPTDTGKTPWEGVNLT